MPRCTCVAMFPVYGALVREHLKLFTVLCDRSGLKKKTFGPWPASLKSTSAICWAKKLGSLVMSSLVYVLWGGAGKNDIMTVRH